MKRPDYERIAHTYDSLWVPRFLPEARAFTEARFWRAERIAEALEGLGLATATLVDRRAAPDAPIPSETTVVQLTAARR